MTQLYRMQLRDGSVATVYSNGIVVAQKTDPKTGRTTQRVQHFLVRANDGSLLGAEVAFPSRQTIESAFDLPATAPYAASRVIVVLGQGVTATKDSFQLENEQIARLRISHATLATAPQYTTDARTNQTMASLGVWRSDRLFRNAPASTLHAMSARAQSLSRRPVLDIGNAYVLRLANSSVPQAVAALRALPTVAYASPDWLVRTQEVGGIPIDTHKPAFATKSLRSNVFSIMRPLTAGTNASDIPTNYGVAASQQSMLNAPGVNAVAAYDEVEKALHQLPGTGVTITNVSIGDIMDASDATSDCSYFETGNGPTTVIMGGQRYLDLPTMPLIPVYTADSSGNLGQESVCGTGDGVLGEIGLDFSVMAPLPDQSQRGGYTLSGSGDLFGIAPGASYRLIVPQNPRAALSDIDAAFVAAAQQQPRPDVITASLGIGVDSEGFPGRYLGDDPLTAAVMAGIVAQDNILLVVSANDGTRPYTPAAIGPSGGAAPTNLAPLGTAPTTIGDDAFSTIPSFDADAGGIVAGGTTLDDIFSAEPQNPSLSPLLSSQQAFPEVRWNGFTVFASGFGSLVNLSAPSDNIVGFEHLAGGNASQIFLTINGGTSASAPEIAAGAAVAIQAARATGRPFRNVDALRAFLIDTATAVPPVPQSDVNNTVGPQLNVGHAVEALLGRTLQPAAPRVAIAQRRGVAYLDGAFVSDTDPNNIDLQGPVSTIDGTETGANAHALITIAPDWEALPAVATRYQLFVTGNPRRILATTSYARLSPTQILAAAGLPLAGASTRTVNLTYRATRGGAAVLAEQQFSLTFSAANAMARYAAAPVVAPVSSGSSIAVSYDLSATENVSNPTLLVSEPGRLNPVTGPIFHPSFTMPLSSLKGTVDVPVASLQGGGIYGISIAYGNVSGQTLYSDFAYTRVSDTRTARPAAPLLGAAGAPASSLGHYAEFPFNTPYQISWYVGNVPGATGAILEISINAPGNQDPFDFKAFNNPNGSERDDNGIDTGSVYYKPLMGVQGTAVFTPASIGLVPTYYSQVRVLATNGSTVLGEAGDESTIREDGVVPSDGSFIPPVSWGITASARQGYFAGNVNLAGGVVQTSIERFDQQSNSITGTLLSTQGRQFYFLPTGTLYGSDVGLYTDILCNPAVSLIPPNPICAGLPNPNSYIISSIANGTIGPVWNQPTFAITTGANNSVNDEALLEGVAVNGPPDIHVALSNLTANTIDKDLDLNQSIPYGYGVWPPGAEDIVSVVENPAKNYAVLGCFCQGSPTLATVNLSSGAVQSIPAAAPGPPVSLPGSGLPAAMAVDTSDDEAIIVPMFSNTGTIYNVTTGAQVAQFYLGQPPGMGPSPLLEEFAAADPVHHVFLVTQNVTTSLFNGDNNAHSLLYVIDENGNIVNTIATMALLAAPNEFPAPNMQINPALREGYVTATDASQLMPFSY